jgi:hypothetical protein
MRVNSPSRIAAESPSREVNRTAYTNCTILARRVEPQIPGISALARWQSRWASRVVPTPANSSFRPALTAIARPSLLATSLLLSSPLPPFQPFLVLRVKPFEIDAPALLLLDQL